MNRAPHGPNELEEIDRNRFDEHLAYRNRVWQVLTSKFFSRLIPADARILDLGCGYGEFLNSIHCAERFAMDMNPVAAQHLDKGVNFIEQDCSSDWPLPPKLLDAVFTSNFFEHVPATKASLLLPVSVDRTGATRGKLLDAVVPATMASPASVTAIPNAISGKPAEPELPPR